MKQKYKNTDKAQRKEPKLTTVISEVGGGINIQSRQSSRSTFHITVVLKLIWARPKSEFFEHLTTQTSNIEKMYF